jgi:hypothetical protein
MSRCLISRYLLPLLSICPANPLPQLRRQLLAAPAQMGREHAEGIGRWRGGSNRRTGVCFCRHVSRRYGLVRRGNGVRGCLLTLLTQGQQARIGLKKLGVVRTRKIWYLLHRLI